MIVTKLDRMRSTFSIRHSSTLAVAKLDLQKHLDLGIIKCRTIRNFLKWYVAPESKREPAPPRISPQEFCVNFAAVAHGNNNRIDLKPHRENINKLCFDVRNPSAFAQGHIPGSLNLPLLGDAEHAHVGEVYTNEGPSAAIALGSEYVASRIPEILESVGEEVFKAKTEFGNGTRTTAGIYCARGGIRSTSVAWLLQREIGSDLQVQVLEKGYKGFREFALEDVYNQQPRLVVVIGGHTGAAKTEVIRSIAQSRPEFVAIDLEGEAFHSGSAFGGLLYDCPQPTTAQFQNNLATHWCKIVDEQPSQAILFLEDEGPHVGNVQLPARLYHQIRTAPLIVRLLVDRNIRIAQLVNDYTGPQTRTACEKKGLDLDAELASSIQRIKKRLGGKRMAEALDALETKNYHEVATTLTSYYDGLYERHVTNHTGCGSGTGERKGSIVQIDLTDDSVKSDTGLLNLDLVTNMISNIVEQSYSSPDVALHMGTTTFASPALMR